MPSLRILFAGTPDFASSILDEVVHAGYTPVAVYTQPDRPAGRGRKLVPSAVKTNALGLACPIEQPLSLKNEEAQKTLAGYKPDLMIVVAYGLILPPAVLQIPTYGCINVHASLLPRWRGAAPIERAYMAGDDRTGVCIMQMDEGLDTGAVFRRAETAIDNKPISEVEEELARLGALTLIETIREIESAHRAGAAIPSPEPQEEAGASYAQKLTAADRQLDFALDASALARRVNALAQRMPVRVTISEKRAQLLAAAVVSGPSGEHVGTIAGVDENGLRIQAATNQLLITALKFEGGKGTPLNGADLLNGHRHLLAPGTAIH